MSQISAPSILSSDHHPIEFTIDVYITAFNDKYKVHCLSKTNWSLFNNHLNNNIDLLNSNIQTKHDIDQEISKFTVLIQDAQQLATPKLAFKYEVCQLSNEINLLKRLRNVRRIQWQRNRQPTLKII